MTGGRKSLEQTFQVKGCGGNENKHVTHEDVVRCLPAVRRQQIHSRKALLQKLVDFLNQNFSFDFVLEWPTCSYSTQPQL